MSANNSCLALPGDTIIVWGSEPGTCFVSNSNGQYLIDTTGGRWLLAEDMRYNYIPADNTANVIGWLLVFLFFVVAAVPPLLLMSKMRHVDPRRSKEPQTIDGTCTVVGREVSHDRQPI